MIDSTLLLRFLLDIPISTGLKYIVKVRHTLLDDTGLSRLSSYDTSLRYYEVFHAGVEGAVRGYFRSEGLGSGASTLRRFQSAPVYTK